jgi:hypothetical protein
MLSFDMKPRARGRVWEMISIIPCSFGRSCHLPLFQAKAVDDFVSRTRTAILSEKQNVKEALEEAETVDVIGKET